MRVTNDCIDISAGKLAAIVESVLRNHRGTLRETGNAIAADPELIAQFGVLAADVIENFIDSLGSEDADRGDMAQAARLGAMCLARDLSPHELVDACASLSDEILRTLEELSETSGLPRALPFAAGRVLQRSILTWVHAALAGYEAARGDTMHELRMADRKRVARDLHDKIGSGITLAICYLDMLELDIRAGKPGTMAAIARTRDSLTGILYSTRTIVADMRHVIPPGSLERELRVFAQSFATARPSVDITVSGDGPEVPPDHRDGLFVILREALRNALVHAFARRVVVRARFGEGKATGVVTDDGAGFAAAAGCRGNGLASMRERAELFGGETEITSQPGQGTRVAVRFPLPGAP